MLCLLKKTVWLRSALNTQARYLEGLGPNDVDPQAKQGDYRKVRFFIQEEQVEFALDVTPESAASRDSYWPRVPTHRVFDINLTPYQTVVGRASEGTNEMSVCIDIRGVAR